MKFHWGDYFLGVWAILFIDYMMPGCYGSMEWELWVLPILVAFFWIREATNV